MTKREAILALFESLEDMGYKPPARWADPTAYSRALALWESLTCSMSPEQLLGVGAAWLRVDVYRQWPMPGSLNECARKLGGSLKLTADEAWGHMVHKAGHNSTRATKPVASAEEVAEHEPTLRGLQPFLMHPDPATASAIIAGVDALGGWRRVGAMELGRAADRASFRKAYEGATGRVDALRLIGSAKQAVEHGRLLEVNRG